ncbi:MAG: S41 family peptidase [Bacteroides sp.]|nr:S41 family peptidase [Bacteroides sp.]
MTRSIFYSLLLIALTSCGVDRWEEYKPLTSLDEWIYNTMSDKYLFNSAMPSYKEVNPFIPAKDFLNNIKLGQDNISNVKSATEVINVGYGFEYTLAQPNNNDTINNIIITYVEPQSPAYRAGMLRGDKFIKVNGEIVSRNTAKNKLKPNGKIELTRGEYKLKQKANEQEPDKFELTEGEKIVINGTEQIAQQAIYKSKIIDVEGKGKIAYLMYNKFISGTEGNAEFHNDKLLSFASEISSNDINTLVLDLRKTVGNDTKAFTVLATMLVSNQYMNSEMGKTVYNENNTARNETLTFNSSLLKGAQKPAISTLIIVCSKKTSGLSEALINVLNNKVGKIIAVGEDTAGIPFITETFQNESKEWILEIPTHVILNTEGTSSGNGFVASVKINTSSDSGEIYNYGDERETVLAQIIKDIKENKFN